MTKANKLAVKVVPVLVDPYHKGTPTRVLFSADEPSSAVLLYEDAPPELHDLRIAGLKKEMNKGDVIEMNSLTRMDGLKFRDPACSAAFRPGHDELAFAFGEGDAFVHRLDPVTGQKLEAVYFENPVCVNYSSDGELLACGANDGTVTIFSLESDNEAVELRSVKLPAAARAIGFDELSNMLVVATENNALIEFAINSDEDTPVKRGVMLEDGTQFKSMQINSVAYGDDGVIAYAGVGNEIWVASAFQRVGGFARLRAATRIYGLQFVEGKSSIVAMTDAGVQILSFELNDEQRPVFDQEVMHFPLIHAEMPMIGCQHFGTMLCVASVLPPDE